MDLAATVYASLLEPKDVLKVYPAVILQADYLGDVDHPPTPIREASLLHDDINGCADLIANSANGEVHPGHQDHRLKARDHVRGGVSMARRQAPIMPGIHRLQHVESFTAPALSNNNTVGPHS